MNLSDMLSYADIAQLTRIADVYGCDCNGNSKHELIQSILATVNRRDVFEQKIASMSIEELRFINYLLFESRESFSLEDLLARVQQCKFETEAASMIKKSYSGSIANNVGTAKKRQKNEAPKETTPREVISRFKQQGWLFNGYSAHNRYLFHVPRDMLQNFKASFQNHLKQQVICSGEPSKYREESGMLVRDMKKTLDYIAMFSPTVVSEGAMYKRNVIQLQELLDVQEELPSKGAWKFGYGAMFGHYPDRLAFIYNYCSSARLVQIHNDQLIVTAEGEQARAVISESSLLQIVQYWLKLYRGPIPNIHSIVYWISHLAKDWVSLSSLKQALIPYIRPYYFDSAEAILDKRIIKMMLHFGILKIGEHEQAGIVLQMTRHGQKLLEKAL